MQHSCLRALQLPHMIAPAPWKDLWKLDSPQSRNTAAAKRVGKGQKCFVLQRSPKYGVFTQITNHVYSCLQHHNMSYNHIRLYIYSMLCYDFGQVQRCQILRMIFENLAGCSAYATAFHTAVTVRRWFWRFFRSEP